MSPLTQLVSGCAVCPPLLSALLFFGVQRSQDPAAATRPATQPATREAADAALDRLLEPTRRNPSTTTNQSVAPAAGGQPNNATGRGAAAVAPDTPRQSLVPEGTYVIDRLVRVRQSVDGRGLEAAFVADGTDPAAAVDPPMLLAPNLNLQSVETVFREDPDRRFRVTGRVSEYRGRNYLLLEKVVVP